MKKNKTYFVPTAAELETELKRVKRKSRIWSVLKHTVYILLTVSAVAVLVATLWLPILEIYGSSMTPTLYGGEIVFSLKTSDFQQEDIVACYYNNNILVKRVIAGPADWVDISLDGTVFVNGKVLEEPYITDKAYGDTNIELPYQVPDGKIFVMGDHRSTSVDSRNSSVGCIDVERVVGKIILRIWPLDKIGPIQ